MKNLYFRPYFLFLLFFVSCSEEISDDSSPKYSEGEFLKLTKLHEIDTTGDEDGNFYIPVVWDMDVDTENNLYVLDYFNTDIKVFDKDGNYVRKMGNEGQGPTELERPSKLYIHNNELIIFEGFKGTKSWSLEGEYISSHTRQNLMNVRLWKPIDDFFIGVGTTIKIDREGTKITSRSYQVQKMSPSFEIIDTVFTVDVDNSIARGYIPTYKEAFNSKTEFFGPSLEIGTYALQKYDLEGNIVDIFSRVYERKPYSSEVKAYFQETYKRALEQGRIEPLAEFPPIIRYAFVDERDYVWVVIGEYAIDAAGNLPIIQTIDIFDNEGVFLYSFESEIIGFGAFIRDGRLYALTGSRNKRENNVIHVYDVQYLK